MDFASPISSVIPSAHGAVLAVLARAGKPLTGRAIAALTEGRVSQSRTNQVLGQLTEAGLALKDEHGSGHFYQLNRDHVATPAVLLLVHMRDELLDRLSSAIRNWDIPPVGAWLFGSAVRGEASSSSDLDLLVVRPDRAGRDNEAWDSQVEGLSAHARAWSGNDVQVLELSRSELRAWAARKEPLIASLRNEALPLSGASIDDVLGRSKGSR